MRRFSIIQPIYMAFYSRDLYRDVARLWGGTVFVYLFLLLALCWIPLTGRLKAEVGSYLQYEMPKVISQIPEVVIKNGQAEVKADMPYTITEPDSGMPFIILDTTGKTTSLAGSEALFLMTKDQLIAKRSKTVTTSYNLSEFGDGTFNKETVSGWVQKADKWFFLIVYPLALFMSYVFRLLQVLLFGAIAIMYDRTLKAGLGYGALVRITAVAITPAVVINAIHASAGLNVPGWSFITFMTAMGYVYFGVLANAPRPSAE